MLVKSRNRKVDVFHVSGKPGNPEGPLDVSDISADSCKLSWNPPRDTGGSPVTNYIVEKMDIDDDTWKPVTKFCRAETYTVPDLVKGKYPV